MTSVMTLQLFSTIVLGLVVFWGILLTYWGSQVFIASCKEELKKYQNDKG